MAKIKDYSQIMINNFSSASNKEIRSVYNKLIKTANERIRVSAKEANIAHASAYKNIVQPLKGASYVKENVRGETVFKALPKNATRSQMAAALQNVQRFMNARTSTIKGIRELIQERRNSIKEQIPGISNAEADDVLKWLGSEEGKQAKQNFDSNVLRMVIAKASKNNKTPLQQQWEEYKQRRAQTGESLEDWSRKLDSMESF